MPDITMCASLTCKKRKTCYRHEESGTKPSRLWQTYANFEPDETGACDNYWQVKKTRSKES